MYFILGFLFYNKLLKITKIRFLPQLPENLDYQLKLTQEEKFALATNLQTSLIENSNNKTSFQNAIAASKQREIALQAEAKDLHNQVTELLTRLESNTRSQSYQNKIKRSPKHNH